MQTSFNWITAIKLTPINRLFLVEQPPPSGFDVKVSEPAGLVDCEALQLNFSESESAWNIRAITTKTGSGGDRQVAWIVECTMMFPHSFIDQIQEQLKKYEGKPVSAIVQLGDERFLSNPGYGAFWLYFTVQGDHDARVEVNHSFGSLELRHRTTINFKGLIRKPELLYTSNTTWWWT